MTVSSIRKPPGGVGRLGSRLEVLSVGESDEPPRLSSVGFAVCLALVVGMFFWLGGAFWNHASDVDQMTKHIVWSYVPIPFVIAIALVIERKLCLASYLIEVLKLTLAKFAITYVFAATVWLIYPPGG